MRGRAALTRFAFLAVLALVEAAQRPASAGEATRLVHPRKASLVPLFDTNRRFKPKKTFQLQFRAREKTSRAPVAADEISFSLLHGKDAAGTELPVRELKAGVFEVPFTPLGPGQYALVVSIRGVPAASIPPVRLGVVGVADGLVEQPPEADLDVSRHRGKSNGKLTR
jgi:hypothetical protein